jgi:hypothetical protein
VEERGKDGFVVLLILCVGSCCSSKSELSNNNSQAWIRAKDLGAIGKLLHKSEGSACMKVKRAGIEEEGRKNSAPSSTCARSHT